MKKRIAAFVLCALMLVPALSGAAFAKAGMDNFEKALEYDDSVFTDIAGRWFEADVRDAYEYGLVEGRGEGLFAPDSTVTVAEAIAMACRVHSTYYETTIAHESGAWYTKYVKYALSLGIINVNQFKDYTREATRSELAVMFYNALPATEYAKLNSVDAIPDMKKTESNYSTILALYRAGVLTGDEDGSFRPKDNITRAESVVILDRVIDATRRVEFTIGDGSSGNEVVSDTVDYVKKNAAGQMETLLSLNTATKTFTFYSFTSTATGAVSGQYDADVTGIACIVSENHMGTLPGADVTKMSFTTTATGLTLISLSSASGTDTVGNLQEGETLLIAR